MDVVRGLLTRRDDGDDQSCRFACHQRSMYKDLSRSMTGIQGRTYTTVHNIMQLLDTTASMWVSTLGWTWRYKGELYKHKQCMLYP